MAINLEKMSLEELHDLRKQVDAQIRNYEKLPEEAKDYIAFIENFTGASVDVVSVGPDNKHTIVRRDPWTQY